MATPVTKKQVERRQSTNAGKKSHLAKNNPPVGDNSFAKAIVIHGVPWQRPMAEIIQDTAVRGVMGAC